MYFAKQAKRTPDVMKSQQPSKGASTTGQIHLKFDIRDLMFSVWYFKSHISAAPGAFYNLNKMFCNSNFQS